jgi:hypothetical protein
MRDPARDGNTPGMRLCATDGVSGAAGELSVEAERLRTEIGGFLASVRAA